MNTITRALAVTTLLLAAAAGFTQDQLTIRLALAESDATLHACSSGITDVLDANPDVIDYQCFTPSEYSPRDYINLSVRQAGLYALQSWERDGNAITRIWTDPDMTYLMAIALYEAGDAVAITFKLDY